MDSPAETPLCLDPQQILLDVAEERSVPRLLQLIVERFAASPRLALARLWLVRPGDHCDSCSLRARCQDRARCLHLVASAGNPRTPPDQARVAESESFRRIPLGALVVGRIAAEGRASIVSAGLADRDGIAHPEWVRAEGIAGFVGQPLIHHGEVLGVLAIFARGAIGSGCADWLRMISNQAAVALVNARAFEEIETLKARLQRENDYLQEEVRDAHRVGAMLGASSALRALLAQIALVAPTDAPVLIEGETGTGKELIAREIHQASRRAERPLIKVNCAAVPRELFESEFFGHVRGAFTGALRDRTGRFELAHGGTLFLDEVGEIPLELQAKLLRVLQEGELERVGEERTRSVDVRIIAATHRNTRTEVDQGRFRSDLYFRLSVFPIYVPPLRERTDDIPILAQAFLDAACRRLTRRPLHLTRPVALRLQAYDWPGNVRELQQVIERAVITTRGQVLEVETLERRRPLDIADPPTPPREREPATVATNEGHGIRTVAEMRQLEVENLRAAVGHTHGKIYGPDGAAALLGLPPTTLLSRLRALGWKGNEKTSVRYRRTNPTGRSP